MAKSGVFYKEIKKIVGILSIADDNIFVEVNGQPLKLIDAIRDYDNFDIEITVSREADNA